MIVLHLFTRLAITVLALLCASGCRKKKPEPVCNRYGVVEAKMPVTVTGGTRIDTLLNEPTPSPQGPGQLPEQLIDEGDAKGSGKRVFVPEISTDGLIKDQEAERAREPRAIDRTHKRPMAPQLEDLEMMSAADTIKPTTQTSEPMIKVDFKDKTLSAIIDHFSAIQKRNIILPPGADALSQKVTFELPKEIPLSQIDLYLDLILEIAGYARVRQGSFFKIVPDRGTDTNINREELRLFAGTAAMSIPDTGERIRAIIYLQNLKVPETPQGNDPMTTMIRGATSPNAELQYDARSNAIILADRANNIRSMLALVRELDTVTVREVIRTITLYNRNATDIAKLLNEFILAAGGDEQQQRAEAGRYFQAGTRIVADPRTNALILMGREPAVERLREFIRTHVDTAPESGNSVLHTYELQYLDAQEFAPILEKIVRDAGSTGQATQQQQEGGAVRGFDGVVVTAEKPEKADVKAQVLSATSSDSTSPGQLAGVLEGEVYRGGNRLVVAANNADWQRIVRLIEELDKPQLQVIIQTVILDFTVNDDKTLAIQTRNPSWMQLPEGITFQADMISANPLLSPTPPPIIPQTTLAADLLQLIAGSSISWANAITSTTQGVGSTILSFNDPSASTPGIWSFIQWLQTFGSTRVLSNPFLVVVNNRKASEEVTTSKRAPDIAAVGEGGAITRKIIDLKASLKITVVPRASSKDRVNIQVSIVIDQFFDPSATPLFNMVTRQLHTNVNLNNGEMVVLGGLSGVLTSDQDFETPLIGRIPILRWFFSNNFKNVTKTNLIVLIAPTIIEPKIPAGMNKYTRDTAEHMHKLIEDGLLLESLRDPIANYFFKDGKQSSVTLMDRYLSESEGDFVYKKHRSSELPSNHHCRELPETGWHTFETVAGGAEDVKTTATPAEAKALAMPQKIKNGERTPNVKKALEARERSKRVSPHAVDSFSRREALDKLRANLALDPNPESTSHHVAEESILYRE